VIAPDGAGVMPKWLEAGLPMSQMRDGIDAQLKSTHALIAQSLSPKWVNDISAAGVTPKRLDQVSAAGAMPR
jgi:hypothetical protein